MLDYSLHSCFLVSGFMKRHRISVMIVNLHKTRLEEKKVDNSIIQYQLRSFILTSKVTKPNFRKLNFIIAGEGVQNTT